MQSSKLEIKSISYSINNNLILDNLSLDILSEEIISIIGPSASGKSSLLRVIAGFDQIDSGRIILNEKIVDDGNLFIKPYQRNVGIIFQDLALFPHLNCAQNILFGISKYDISEKNARLSKLSNLLDIKNILEKFPHEISGGQQQRIAIARALAPKPELLLFDEPFSALDEELKDLLIADVKALLKTEKITSVFVTHNIKEAFQLSDKIAYLSDRRIIQNDTPYNIYHKPSSKEIAHFCGNGCFIRGTVIDSNHVATPLGKLFGDTMPYKVNDNVDVMVRPDDVIHDDNSTESARVIEKKFFGPDFLYKLELKDGQNILCLTPSHHDHSINDMIGIRAQIDHLVLFNI